jgi:hypothetical protein
MADRRLGNWLKAYQLYTEGTESPPLFHLWVGLSTLAAAAQRKIFMDHDFFKTHTNMYVVLVSPPGRSRKSTAMSFGKNLLKKVPDYGQEINFSSDATSAAALVQQFIKLGHKEHQSLTTFSSELGTLIRMNDSDIVGFLTDIYGCEPGWNKQTVGRGLEMIEAPWLNLLGATTPAWMGDNLSKTALEGGFVRRIVFVYADSRLMVAIPKMTAVQKALQRDLAADLAHIASLKGEFKFASPDVEKYYVGWYEDPKRLELETDPRLTGYYECKAEHIKKVAMMLSLAESDKLRLEVHHLKAAIGMLGELESGMSKAFSSVGKNPFSTDMDRIADQVNQQGRVKYKQLLAMNIHALEKKQFDDTLATLLEINKVYVQGGWLYSPVEWALKEEAEATRAAQKD